jgi:hypothetical protein
LYILFFMYLLRPVPVAGPNTPAHNQGISPAWLNEAGQRSGRGATDVQSPVGPD